MKQIVLSEKGKRDNDDHQEYHQFKVKGERVTKVDAYKWGIKDVPGTFKMIDKKMLRIDASYQRDLNDEKAKFYASNWSWIGCSTISVAHRDSCFYVMDGQHRVAASLRRADIRELPCMVWESSAVAEEAESFLNANVNRSHIRIYDRFRALLILGDESAIQVERLLRDAERKIGSGGHSEGAIASCIGALLSWSKKNRGMLDKMWPLICAICHGNRLHKRIVDGLLHIESLMPENQSLTDSRWRDRLMKVGYSGLLDAAAKASAYYSKGGNKVWAIGILDAINKGLMNKLSIEKLNT